MAQMQRSERAEMRAAIERTDMAELQRAQITARIKQARTEAGLTQHEMAEALDVGPRTYQNYESEKAPRVPWALIGKIAELTGKSSQWLLHGTPDLIGEISGDRAQLDRLEAKLDELRNLWATELLPRLARLDQLVTEEAEAPGTPDDATARTSPAKAPGQAS